MDKKFVKPEADIIEFLNEDIIVTSGEAWWGHGKLEDIPSPEIP